MDKLQATFDKVVVVNLARRPQRLQRFWAALGPDWPFRHPERFEAVDGQAVPVPGEWKQGAGAWGCMLSHRQVVRSAIADGLDSILILEDDASPIPSFATRVPDFLARVPADWDCLMLGGQHLRQPIAIGPGIVQCVGTQRTHAFALRRTMMPGLLKFWETVTNDHCDIVLSACMRFFKAYAPVPFLIGQDAGFSDITLQEEPTRFIPTRSRGGA